MTITETIWATVYAAEYQRFASDWAVAQRTAVNAAPAEIAAAWGTAAAASADAAVANVPYATQAALEGAILLLKPAA